MNKEVGSCMNCKHGNVGIYDEPCKSCIIKSVQSNWEPNTIDIPVLVGFENVQDEIMSAAISFAEGRLDIEQTLDWMRQILLQNGKELLDDEAEENLMDGDLEDQFERLMK